MDQTECCVATNRNCPYKLRPELKGSGIIAGGGHD